MGLQFSLIEANLLGFFLANVRNSREKFDEIKEKFAINPAPIASQSSLNAGGSRWIRDLPQNSHNSFMNRSKVEEQRKNTWLFKGEISPKIVADWRGRGVELMHRGCGFPWLASWLHSRDESASIFASTESTIELDRGHDQAPIAKFSPAVFDWNRAAWIVALIPLCRSLDRVSITPRSRFDRTAIVEFFRKTSWPSDGASYGGTVTIARSHKPWS